MCGRARQSNSLVSGVLGSSSGGALASASAPGLERNECTEWLDADCPGDDNMSPGRTALVLYAPLLLKESDRPLKRCAMKWGLVARQGTKAKPLEEGPSKHFKDTQFNCIADGAGGMKGEDKDAIRAAQPMAPAFKKLLDKKQSCVVPMDGFYEWTQESKLEGGEKQPHYIHSKAGGRPLLMAGLWKECCMGDGRVFKTFTILTTAACPSLAGKIHTRMPVLLTSEEAAREWLASPTTALMTRLAEESTGSDELKYWPVSKKIGNTKNRVEEPWKEVKINKPVSVASFFGSANAANKKPAKEPAKEPTEPPKTSPPPQTLKRERAEEGERGFNSPKKSPIPANFERSPLHPKFDPDWASKKTGGASSRKKAKTAATKPPTKAAKSLLNYFSPCPTEESKPALKPTPNQPLPQWACRICTLLNDALLRNSTDPRTSCEACGALKEDPSSNGTEVIDIT